MCSLWEGEVMVSGGDGWEAGVLRRSCLKVM